MAVERRESLRSKIKERMPNCRELMFRPCHEDRDDDGVSEKGRESGGAGG